MELSFSPGPIFEKNLTKSMLDHMQISAFEEYIQFQHQALQNIRSALPPNKSLIGFTGGPITLYHFAIRNNPIADNLFEQALPVLQKLIEKNIAIQFQNDIDLLMIFDTEANQLTDQEFQDFCLPFIKQIADQYPNQIGYFTKNISPNKFELLKKISNLRLTVLGTQHNIFQELSQTHLSLQGNFSNDLLTIPEKSDFLSALEEYIDLCKSYDVSQRTGWIASLDHGVQKITPETNIHLFIDQIRTKLA
jgi:uroporphyrinogen decarboxylase